MSLPDLIIDGDGVGAVLTLVTKTVGSGSTETKVIDYIKVVSGGQNYTQDETTVTVSPAGSGAQFLPILQEWRINLVERFFNTNKITSDDGFITRGVNDAYGCLLYTSPSPRDYAASRMPSSA